MALLLAVARAVFCDQSPARAEQPRLAAGVNRRASAGPGVT